MFEIGVTREGRLGREREERERRESGERGEREVCMGGIKSKKIRRRKRGCVCVRGGEREDVWGGGKQFHHFFPIQKL